MASADESFAGRSNHVAARILKSADRLRSAWCDGTRLFGKPEEKAPVPAQPIEA